MMSGLGTGYRAVERPRSNEHDSSCPIESAARAPENKTTPDSCGRCGRSGRILLNQRVGRPQRGPVAVASTVLRSQSCGRGAAEVALAKAVTVPSLWLNAGTPHVISRRCTGGQVAQPTWLSSATKTRVIAAKTLVHSIARRPAATRALHSPPPAKLLRSGHISNPSPVIGGGAPSYGAEGEGRRQDASDCDVGIRKISTEAFPLRPCGPPPPITGEETKDAS
jgi:hypothetical protein